MENSPLTDLKNALDQLNASKNLVEAAFSNFESQDLPKENEKLRENLKLLTEKFENNEKILTELKNEYSLLEKNFKDELTFKRAFYLGMGERQMQNYFSMHLQNETTRINYTQFEVRQKLESMLSELKILESGEVEQLQAELNILAGKINEQAAAARKRMDDAWGKVLFDTSKASENMQASEVSEIEYKALKAVRNFFNWESFFGLRLISSLGILLIIIGVFTFGRYVYLQMSNAAQCASIFALGLVFLIAGEILNKKWRGVFSLALTAGGSGILFLATALGYLTLGVLSMIAALGICAGVSVLSFVLAIRHNSQTISIFALVGGYLPMLALESNSDITIWATIYFTILNLFSLALATRKSWRISRFIGLFSGLFAEFIIIVLVAVGEYYINWNLTRTAVISVIAISYIAYLIIPVFGASFTKTRIKPADIVLLSFNVLFGFMIGLTAFYSFNLSAYNALVPAFFAASCIIMAILSEGGAYKSIQEKDKGSLRALFFVTSVTFLTLVILFWFDRVWFSSGWLIEGVGLLLYGLLKNRKRFTIAGSIVGAICLWGFLTFNVWYYTRPLFVWQYLLMTLGASSVAVILAVKKIPQTHKETQLFQFAAAFNVWIFLLYLLQNPVLEYLRKVTPSSAARNIIVLICIALGILYSYILPKIRIAYCGGVHAVSVVIGLISIVWLFVFNALSKGISQGDFDMTLKVIVIGLYIITNVIGVLWTGDLLKFMVLKKTLPLKFYPLLFSIYLLFSLLQNLIVQFELGVSSMILTFIFGITALCWIIFGFAKKNNIIRISGLSLSFFAMIKLFVLDLSGLSTELKIVSYFAMGVLLLAISFTYQYFSKKLKEAEK